MYPPSSLQCILGHWESGPLPQPALGFSSPFSGKPSLLGCSHQRYQWCLSYFTVVCPSPAESILEPEGREEPVPCCGSWMWAQQGKWGEQCTRCFRHSSDYMPKACKKGSKLHIKVTYFHNSNWPHSGKQDFCSLPFSYACGAALSEGFFLAEEKPFSPPHSGRLLLFCKVQGFEDYLTKDVEDIYPVGLYQYCIEESFIQRDKSGWAKKGCEFDLDY